MAAVLFVLLLLVLYPTVFDKRPNVFAYTKWGADTVGLIIGYISVLFGLKLLPQSGGKMKQGLIWFTVGMFVMGSSLFFGPILDHYKILAGDSIEALHGIGMLGGMIGYLIAHHIFLSIGAGTEQQRRNYIMYGAVFLIFFFAYLPTMSVGRTIGNDVKYWTELTGFGLGGVMAAMAATSFRSIGGRYRMVMNWLIFSAIFMVVAYPFGPISQPNTLWTGPQGGTIHHGIMAIAMLFFLVTTILLQRLQVYVPPKDISSC